MLIHPAERELVDGATGDLEPGDDARHRRPRRCEALHTPGHTRGMLSLVVGGTDVFTGDTLFKNSVGGVRAPGHTTYADLRHSIMDVLLQLPPETTIRPGHTDPTTVAEELETNAFVRVWRGPRPRGRRRLHRDGRAGHAGPARQRLRRRHQAWVRWPDGADGSVPGSQVQRFLLALLLAAPAHAARDRVRWETGGGIAWVTGTNLTVHTDRTARAEAFGKAAGFRLGDRRWAQLGRRLRAARFGTLQRVYRPEFPVADGMYDEVRYRGRAVPSSPGAKPPRPARPPDPPADADPRPASAVSLAWRGVSEQRTHRGLSPQALRSPAPPARRRRS